MITADTVIINGKVATVDKDFSFKEAIAVKDGWIIDVGGNDEISAFIGPDTNVIDLGGKVILPGAHDSHIHALSFTFNNTCCYLGPEAVTTVPEICTVLAEEVKKFAPGEWVQGAGFNPLLVEGRNHMTDPVTCWDIDVVTPDNPVAIMHGSAHGLLANSMAMEICGVTKETPDPPGGIIGRDTSGRPNGVFTEMSSIAMITGGIPQWSDDAICEAILKVQKLLNSEGYTSYTDSTLGPANDSRECAVAGSRAIYAYKRLFDEKKLTARVSMGFYSGIGGMQSFELLKRDLDNFSFPEFNEPNWLELKLLKFFADGTSASHTAWMKNDYLDMPGFHGRSRLCAPGAADQEQIRELHQIIELAHMRGFQVGIHTMGDLAVKAAIDGFINAMQKYPGENRRHNVIHGDMLGDREDFIRAAKYGIVVSAQPTFREYKDDSIVSVVDKKGRNIMGFQEIKDLGVVIAGGSDAIAGELMHWRKAVQSAVTLKSPVTGEALSGDKALSVEDAVRMFTINGAYQEQKEHIRGSIEIGKVADFQVLDRDIFEADPEEIGGIMVVMTMVGGRVVFER